MSTTTNSLVQKLWNYCNVLRDDGMSYGDYVEQLTYLLFLKMADERSQPPYNQPSIVPAAYAWPTLLQRDGDELFDHYRHMLERLGQERGTLGLIFGKAQNKFQDPAKLRRLSGGPDQRRELDHSGCRREGRCLRGPAGEKRARHQERRGPVLHAPRPDCRHGGVHGPAAGRHGVRPGLWHGGLFVCRARPCGGAPQKPDARAAQTPERAGLYRLRAGAKHGAAGDEPAVARHWLRKAVPVVVGDALAADPGQRFDVVLANPPFGKKSSTVIVGEDGRTSTEKDTIERDDFWATTSNKQLNFVQHIKTLLKTHGRAAVVLPDNVLFEGGAGETIRKKLLHECDVHTLLRLPTGLFYAQGVKANVLFFEKRPASETPWTTQLWIYDLRTNQHFTLKTNPLRKRRPGRVCGSLQGGQPPPAPAHLVSRSGRRQRPGPEGRWRAYSHAELLARDKASLDIFWLKDDSLADSDNLPPPGVIAQEIVEDLQAALEQFRLIAGDLCPAMP
jgi:type I restriction enzyme M protein